MSSGVDQHTRAEHEALKSDPAWDKLEWRKEWVFDDEILEQRNCSCGTTLARKSTRTVFVFGCPTTIGPAIHAIRFFKGIEHSLKAVPHMSAAARHARETYERALLELCAPYRMPVIERVRQTYSGKV